MTFTVDSDLCIGCGLCIDTCPDVFDWDGNVAKAITSPVPSASEAAALEAEDGCPTDAISHS